MLPVRSNVVGAVVATPYALYMLTVFTTAVTDHDLGWGPLQSGAAPWAYLALIPLWTAVILLPGVEHGWWLGKPANRYPEIPPPTDHLHAVRPILDIAGTDAGVSILAIVAVLMIGPNTLLIQQFAARLHRRCTGN